ncbi:acyltransferase family protein [Chitinophaga japonensis]|uniref:Fucose 4-O-acetylase-like acetyltransferase n=1 Tax=Chitinophaga japonensis TaxID=104662 RepID=A0A562SXV7_CHIJA|nr:acyltransferase [Chitinophaga japonensis]TWI86197.1 fucose 4-O-acetylase-like acetyltransferase [Chitinophaga japonensis]
MRIPEKLNYIFSFRPEAAGRYAWVDYAKGIAIIFVVYRHVLYGLLYSGVPANPLMMDANEILYGFRMPLFFFLSGLFFGTSLQKRGGRSFLVSKVNTLLYPYMLWCFIQLTLQIIFSDYTNFKRGVGNYIDILIHPRGMLQQWYLFALFNVSALYLFNHAVLKLKAPVQILLGLAFLAMIPLAGTISTISDVMLFYIFFCLGHVSAPWFFRESTQQQLASGYKALLLLPVFIVAQYYCMRYPEMNIYLYSGLAMLGALLVIMLSFLLAKYRLLGFLQTLGNYSLYIYLLHLGIVFLLRQLLLRSGLGISMPVMTLLLVTAGIMFSIILYRICLLLHLEFLFKGPFKTRRGTLQPIQ